MTDAEQLMALFAGSDLAFGRSETSDKVSPKGKRETRSWIEKRPVTLKDWEGHVEGKAGIGIPPITSKSEVHWGAIDVDDYKKDIKVMNERIQQLQLPLVVCRSKSGGPHLFLFLTEWVPAQIMIDKLDSLAGTLGLGMSEVFPKQAKVANDGTNADYGSWINMPYFGGTSFMRYALDEKGEAIDSVTKFTAYVAGRALSAKQLEALEPPPPRTIPFPDGPPCLNSIMANGVAEMRNITLANIAVYTKKAYPETWQAELDKANRLFAEPLGAREVEALKKSYGKKDYKYQCNQQPLCNYCESSKCRKLKYGVGGGADFLPSNRSLTKIETEPAIWFLDINVVGTAGRDANVVRISMTTEQLQNPVLFQRRVMETMNQMPPLMGKDEWREFVAGLMKHVTVIEVPPEATPEGQLLELVEDFCATQAKQPSFEDILRGLPFKDHENYSFRLKDLLAYLKAKRFDELKRNQIISTLQNRLKMMKGFKHIQGEGVRFVTIPANTVFSDPKLHAPKFERAY